MCNRLSTVSRLFLGSLTVFILLTTGCMPPATNFETPEFRGVSSSATEGYYTDRVAVSWSAVEEAATYKIYRSESADGSFAEIASVNPNDPDRRVENAEDSLTVYPDPIVHADDWVDPRFLNFSYRSEVDVSGGKYIAAWQGDPELRIIIGSGPEADADLNFKVSFPSLVTILDLGAKYSRDAIIGAIIDGAGAFICDKDDDDRYLKFDTTLGPIVMKNEHNTMSYSPIDYFIKDGVGKNQILVINKDGTQVLDSDQYTGNLGDYFGTEFPPEPDPEPVVIKRSFPEGNIYYYDDKEVELGKHYFYRVLARRENGTLISMSSCKEGYFVSANASNAPQNVTVSQGEFPDKVTVSWDPVSGDGVTYRVYRAIVYPGTFDSSAPLAEGLTEPTFEDTTIPAGINVYRIVAYNSAGEEGKPSDTVTGFRTINLEEFIHIAYYETVMGEQRTAQALGVGRVADYDSGADANRTLPGFISGTINYNLNVSGTSGTGTWTFKNYSNFGLTVTGVDSMKSGMSKDGDVRGKLYVDALLDDDLKVVFDGDGNAVKKGSYPGYIDYFLHVNSGDVAVGSNSFFMVQLYSPEWMIANYGSEEVKVSYSKTLAESPY